MIKNKLFAFDLNGTLLTDGFHVIRYDVASRIKELNKSNKVILITGMPWEYSRPLYDMLDLNDEFIGYNGQQIVFNGVTEYTSCLSEETTKLILSNDLLLEASSFIYVNGIEYLYAFDSDSQEDLKAIDYDPAAISFMVDDAFTTDKINIDNVNIIEWKMRNNKKLIIFSPQGDSKFNSLEKICKSNNIIPEDVYYFGDGVNDIESLKFFGTGITTSNANDEVKQASDVILSGSNNTDAIAKYLDEIMIK